MPQRPVAIVSPVSRLKEIVKWGMANQIKLCERSWLDADVTAPGSATFPLRCQSDVQLETEK
jgi:hypothetical protein